MWWPRSTYDSDSFANRFPPPSTMIECGMDRSLTRNMAEPSGVGDGTEPPHHASSMRSTAAPIFIATSMAEPTLPRDPEESAPVTPWKRSRHSTLWSKPPPPRTTPRAAAIVRAVSYTHLRAHETVLDLVCRLLL